MLKLRRSLSLLPLVVVAAAFGPASGASAQAAQSLRAPFNGKLIALHVQEGQLVQQGDAVLVIESMKLEHILCAPRDAVVHSLSASVGQQVGPGQVLVQWKDAT